MVLLALMQANAAVLDVKTNCAAVEEAAREASAAGAQLLLTPELFPVGYAPLRLRADLDPADSACASGRPWPGSPGVTTSPWSTACPR